MFVIRRRRVSDHWTNYGCLNFNISTMTGLTDSEQQQYLSVAKSAFPTTPGVIHWIRESRDGILATSGIPSWDTDAARYWPNMYFRPTASDVTSTRKIMFDPVLWIRPDGVQPIMCNPNAAPNPFGRNSSGVQVVADVDNTWRRDIRLNLDRLCWDSVS